MLTATCTKIIDENEEGDTGFGVPVTEIDSQPTWSPDGKWIAYVHYQIGSDSDPDGIYMIRPDGTDKTLWLAGRASNPDWSPDGKWIAYKENRQIFKQTIEGDSVLQLTFANRNHFPSWSPDGEWIAFDSDRFANSTLFFIWKMRSDGSHKTLIAFAPDEGSIRQPIWTSNNSIIHTRSLKEAVGEEIFVMDSNGKDVYRLTYNNSNDRDPSFSSAHSVLTYTSFQSDNSNIWMMHINGYGHKNMTPEPEIWGFKSCWSPEGEKIVFTNINKGNGRLWIMNKDGSNKKQLTH